MYCTLKDQLEMIYLKIINTYSAPTPPTHNEWKFENIKCFICDKKGPKFGKAYITSLE